jgi:hypothetical protein
MRINSLADLDKLESYIINEFSRFNLGDVLSYLSSLKGPAGLKPFEIAGASLFAIRACSPSKVSQVIKTVEKDVIQSLIDLSTNYYIADPVTFDDDLHHEFMNSNPVFMVLRHASSQFPFEMRNSNGFSRAILLFHDIPKQLEIGDFPEIPEFDFQDKFKAITGVSTLDFIIVGFLVFIASSNHFSINHNWFKKARKQGLNIPSDNVIREVLFRLAASKSKLTKLYEDRKNEDRRFRMYDFNPLILYPVIQPCQDKQFSPLSQDFIHAPVPELVASRISMGIFYEMYNAHSTKHGNKFSEYFGHVFERYVGLIAEKCITSEELISEGDIRRFYPKEKGKSPDWILIDSSTLILVECKATRFTRDAQAIASEEAVNDSLKQVKKGLIQLHEFISACKRKVPGLERFHDCITFKPVLISLEPLYSINSILFREHIDRLLAEAEEKITGLDWQILSIDELEILQPHCASGFKLAQILDELSRRNSSVVLNELNANTSSNLAHSFLNQKQEELYQRLGISEIDPLKQENTK